MWQLANELRRGLYAAVAHGRFDRHAALRHQLISSTDSACANVAEGFSRFTPKDFARFVRMAKGSLSEALEHIGFALELELITPTEAERLRTLARRARGAATRLILYLDRATPPGRDS